MVVGGTLRKLGTFSSLYGDLFFTSIPLASFSVDFVDIGTLETNNMSYIMAQDRVTLLPVWRGQ